MLIKIRKMVSFLVIFIFVAGQFQPVFASENLAVFTPDGVIRDFSQDTVKKAFPSAVGKGLPLKKLLREGRDWMPRLNNNEYKDLLGEVKEATDLALNLYVQNRKKVPQVDEYGNELRKRSEKTKDKLINFRMNTNKQLFLFAGEEVIERDEDYLILFKFLQDIGVSVEFINYLYLKYPKEIARKRLAQALFHEATPEHLKNKKGEVEIDLTDHELIYKKIQPLIFGKDEVKALGKDFRDFINISLLVGKDKLRDMYRKRDFGFFDENLKFLSYKSLTESDLKGKVVYVRFGCDIVFDKTKDLKDPNRITDSTRIDSALPTIEHIIRNGGKIVLQPGWIKRPGGVVNKNLSVIPVFQYIRERLKERKIIKEEEMILTPTDFETETPDSVYKNMDKIQALVKKDLRDGDKIKIVCLENPRFDAEYNKGSLDLAKKIAEMVDLAVFDDYPQQHRPVSDVKFLPLLVPSYVGERLGQEINVGNELLKRLTKGERKPFALLIGGTKTETAPGKTSKVTVALNLIKRGLMCEGDKVIIGGGVSYGFLVAKKYLEQIKTASGEIDYEKVKKISIEDIKSRIGDSFISNDSLMSEKELKQAHERIFIFAKLLRECEKRSIKVLLPETHKIMNLQTKEKRFNQKEIPIGWMGTDIDGETIEKYKQELKGIGIGVMAGPMGIMDNPETSESVEGTDEILMALQAETLKNDAYTLSAGGESTSEAIKIKAQLTFCSVGGGSTLEYIEKEGHLDGLVSLASSVPLAFNSRKYVKKIEEYVNQSVQDEETKEALAEKKIVRELGEKAGLSECQILWLESAALGDNISRMHPNEKTLDRYNALLAITDIRGRVNGTQNQVDKIKREDIIEGAKKRLGQNYSIQQLIDACCEVWTDKMNKKINKMWPGDSEECSIVDKKGRTKIFRKVALVDMSKDRKVIESIGAHEIVSARMLKERYPDLPQEVLVLVSGHHDGGSVDYFAREYNVDSEIHSLKILMSILRIAHMKYMAAFYEESPAKTLGMIVENMYTYESLEYEAVKAFASIHDDVDELKMFNSMSDRVVQSARERNLPLWMVVIQLQKLLPAEESDLNESLQKYINREIPLSEKRNVTKEVNAQIEAIVAGMVISVSVEKQKKEFSLEGIQKELKQIIALDEFRIEKGLPIGKDYLYYYVCFARLFGEGNCRYVINFMNEVKNLSGKKEKLKKDILMNKEFLTLYIASSFMDMDFIYKSEKEEKYIWTVCLNELFGSEEKWPDESLNTITGSDIENILVDILVDFYRKNGQYDKVINLVSKMARIYENVVKIEKKEKIDWSTQCIDKEKIDELKKTLGEIHEERNNSSEVINSLNKIVGFSDMGQKGNSPEKTFRSGESMSMLSDPKIGRRLDGYKNLLRFFPTEELNVMCNDKSLLDWIYEEVSSVFEVLSIDPAETAEDVAMLGRDVGRCAGCLSGIAKIYLNENYTGIDSKRKAMEIMKKLEDKTKELDDDQVLLHLALLQCELKLCDETLDVIKKITSESLQIELLKILAKTQGESGDVLQAKMTLNEAENLIEKHEPHSLAQRQWPDIKGSHLAEIKTIKENLKGLDEREELKDTDITVQAEFLRHSLIEWRKEHPEEMLLIAIDDDIGKEQDSQIAPLWKIANAIKTMTDDDGNPLFTDKKPLKITRRSGSRGELMQEINDLLKSETKLSKNNIFLVGQWINIDKHKFDELKGSAWITGINDSQAGRELYLPVFEALTLTIMSSFNMDIESIKSFYDKIADNSVSEQLLRQMIENKVIYLLPRMDRKSKNIRKTYEIVRNIYQSV